MVSSSMQVIIVTRHFFLAPEFLQSISCGTTFLFWCPAVCFSHHIPMPKSKYTARLQPPRKTVNRIQFYFSKKIYHFTNVIAISLRLCVFEINHHIFNESSWTCPLFCFKENFNFLHIENWKISWINQIQIIGIRYAENFCRRHFPFSFIKFVFSCRSLLLTLSQNNLFFIFEIECVCVNQRGTFANFQIFPTIYTYKERKIWKCEIECIPSIGKFSYYSNEICHILCHMVILRWIWVKKWRSHFAIS